MEQCQARKLSDHSPPIKTALQCLRKPSDTLCFRESPMCHTLVPRPHLQAALDLTLH